MPFTSQDAINYVDGYFRDNLSSKVYESEVTKSVILSLGEYVFDINGDGYTEDYELDCPSLSSIVSLLEQVALWEHKHDIHLPDPESKNKAPFHISELEELFWPYTGEGWRDKKLDKVLLDIAASSEVGGYVYEVYSKHPKLNNYQEAELQSLRDFIHNGKPRNTSIRRYILSAFVDTVLIFSASYLFNYLFGLNLIYTLAAIIFIYLLVKNWKLIEKGVPEITQAIMDISIILSDMQYTLSVIGGAGNINAKKLLAIIRKQREKHIQWPEVMDAILEKAIDDDRII